MQQFYTKQKMCYNILFVLTVSPLVLKVLNTAGFPLLRLKQIHWQYLVQGVTCTKLTVLIINHCCNLQTTRGKYAGSEI